MAAMAVLVARANRGAWADWADPGPHRTFPSVGMADTEGEAATPDVVAVVEEALRSVSFPVSPTSISLDPVSWAARPETGGLEGMRSAPPGRME